MATNTISLRFYVRSHFQYCRYLKIPYQLKKKNTLPRDLLPNNPFLFLFYISITNSAWCKSSNITSIIRGVRGKFFRGGKIIFPDFFPGVKCFFPVENFHSGRPKTNFSGFEKWKAKKKVFFSFCNFSSFHFQFSTFPFPIFLLFFLHFLFSLPLFSR